MAMPTKSAVFWAGGSVASGEPAPNTFTTSELLFSSTVLATDTLPTSQPARVNGTQGAGAILPSSFTISGVPSGMMLVQ